jgi:hypothetical protein
MSLIVALVIRRRIARRSLSGGVSTLELTQKNGDHKVFIWDREGLLISQ